MAEPKKTAVSTKDTAALSGHTTVSDENAHDALGRRPGDEAPKVADASAPVKVKVVDEPEPDGPAPYSTREGRLTDEEQISKYGHVLEPAEPYISEGMRHDLVQNGYTYDPISRKRIELA